MDKVILHVVNSNHFSGLESVAFDIITNTKDKYKHIYVTKNGPIIEQLNENKINYEIIKKLSVSEMRRVCKKYKPILIHAHDYTASCVCAFSFLNTSIISHLHNNSPWIKKINLKSILLLLSSIRLKKILLVSKSIVDEYVFGKRIKKKCIIVNNPVSVDKIKNKVSSKSDKKYDICCIARLTEQKNPYLFVNVIAKLVQDFPNLKSIWIGEGELKDEIENKIKELQLENNIELLGFKKNPYIYLSESKIFLLTSDWEGYGLVAFEALSLGVPAIVSKVGGLPMIVDNSCGALCNNQEEFVDNVKEILNNPKKYKKKSDAAIQKSISLDNYLTYFQKIDEIYKKVIDEDK